MSSQPSAPAKNTSTQPAKPAFNYAQAAKKTVQQAASSSQASQASVASSTASTTPTASTSSTPAPPKTAQTTQTAKPTAPADAPVNGSTPADAPAPAAENKTNLPVNVWNKGAPIHMPKAPASVAATANAGIQFGSIGNEGKPVPASPSPVPQQNQSGGVPPPAQVVNAPTFGTINEDSKPAAAAAAIAAPADAALRPPTHRATSSVSGPSPTLPHMAPAQHARRESTHSTQSNVSDFRAQHAGPQSPHRQYQTPQYPAYPQQYAAPGAYGYPPQGQFNPNQTRGPRPGSNQAMPPYQGRPNAQQGPRTPQMMNSQPIPQWTPTAYAQTQQYMPVPGQYPGMDMNMYYQQQQQMYYGQVPAQPAVQPTSPRPFAAAVPGTAPATPLSRSASSDRPATASSQAEPKTPLSSFVRPSAKKSSAIKIINPNTLSEVEVPKGTPTPAEKTPTPVPAELKRTISPAVSTPPRSPVKADAPKSQTADEKAAVKAAFLKKVQEAKEKDEREAREAAEKVMKDAEEAEKKKAEEAEKAKREEEEKKAAEEKVKKDAEEAEEKAKKDAEEAEERKKDAEKAEERKKADEEVAAKKAEEEAAAAKKAEEDATAAAAKKVEDDAAAAAAAEAAAAAAAAKKEDDEAKLAAAAAAVSESAHSLPTIDEKPTDGTGDEEAASTDKKDRKPAPAAIDIVKAMDPSVPSPAMTALRSARLLEDLKEVSYPEGINSPNPALNANATDGKFKYDRDFLLQFQDAYTEKPNIDWDARIKECIGDLNESRSKMGSRSNSRASGAPAQGGAPFQMGQFSTGKAFGSTSQDRFAFATQQLRAGRDPSLNAPSGSFAGIGGKFQQMPPISRQGSSTALAGSPRTNSRSTRGSRRGGEGRQDTNREQKGAPTIPLDQVKPLEMSTNRWAPRTADKKEESVAPAAEEGQELMAPEMVQRKVKSALNKLTLEKFDKISDQILEIAAQSKFEKDGRTLRQVIQLTFEKATDEPTFSNMYARFCRKTMETVDPSISDNNVHDKAGNPVTGGALFRKYLLNRCQEDFERGWKSQLPPKPEGDADTKEAELMSEEYYIAAAAKRRGLGLVRFIGELYKLSMLTEKIMHECIRRLLANIVDPEEEEIESLCKLLTTVGGTLDNDKGRQLMNAYFDRMHSMLQSDAIASRMKFMIMDVIDLRKANWKGKEADKGPKTIQEIHEEAAAAKAAADAARPPAPSRGGSRAEFGRGDARLSRQGSTFAGGAPAAQANADGWTLQKSASNQRAGDLTKMGSIRSGVAGSFGPSSAGFTSLRSNSKKGSQGGNALSKEPSASSRAGTPPTLAPPQATKTLNPFDLLGDGNEDDHKEEASEETLSARPRLNLLPRTIPVEPSPPSPSPAEGEEGEEEEEKPVEEESVEDVVAEMEEAAPVTEAPAEAAQEIFGEEAAETPAPAAEE
ncbi:hypothetical protein YB2330_001351 [Saitoella coloradoensis]